MDKFDYASVHICHITSVHTRDDIRIFVKECTSLAQKGFKVSLIVADGGKSETVNKVEIIGVQIYRNRFLRILLAPLRILRACIRIKSAIFHMHDPELIPVGIMLKLLGKKVIFDAHEDFSKQILSKPYINKNLRKIVSFAGFLLEKIAMPHFDYIVSATNSISVKFAKYNKRSIALNNYPLVDDFQSDMEYNRKPLEIAYVGGISEIRGIRQIVQAMEFTRNTVILNLVGDFENECLHDEVKKYAGWKSVKEHGYLERKEVGSILNKSRAGIVTFLPVPNHVNSQPNKIFEYMSASIPVIASNFPLWKELVEDNKCGICVDPYNPQALATAIDWIIENEENAQKMGETGRMTVLGKCNWEKEKEKLFAVYEEIVNKNMVAR